MFSLFQHHQIKEQFFYYSVLKPWAISYNHSNRSHMYTLQTSLLFCSKDLCYLMQPQQQITHTLQTSLLFCSKDLGYLMHSCSPQQSTTDHTYSPNKAILPVGSLVILLAFQTRSRDGHFFVMFLAVQPWLIIIFKQYNYIIVKCHESFCSFFEIITHRTIMTY